jgi:hypothetical protein
MGERTAARRPGFCFVWVNGVSRCATQCRDEEAATRKQDEGHRCATAGRYCCSAGLSIE